MEPLRHHVIIPRHEIPNQRPIAIMKTHPFSLEGKSVFVTGAAGIGVGRGVCQAVEEAGGRLFIGSRSRESAEKACALYRDAHPVVGDVAVEAEVTRMFDELEARFGGVDHLVNNAGIGLSRPIAEAETQDFDRLCGTDLRGLWMMSRRYIQGCLRRKSPGSLVNISSVHAHSTMARYSTYAGIKAGVEGLTRGIAVECGPQHIRCNAISPGYVHAQQNLELIATWTDDPLGWLNNHTVNQQALPYEIEAVDCGRAVVFLLSDAARCITGQSLYVDNGMTAMLYNKDFV